MSDEVHPGDLALSTRRVAAEAFGVAMLIGAGIGSGIMRRLSPTTTRRASND